jgi:hypothetical protein
MKQSLHLALLVCLGCAEPRAEHSAADLDAFVHAHLVRDHEVVLVSDVVGWSLRRDLLSTELLLASDGADGVELVLNGRAIEVIEHGVSGGLRAEGGSLRRARANGFSYWTIGERGFEEWLTIERGHAYADRAIARWSVTGHDLRACEAGGAHVLDESGEPIVYVSAPAAFDEAGESIPVELRVEDGALALYADAGGRAVLVDPMWMTTDSMTSARSEFRQGHGLERIPGGAIITGGQVGSVDSLTGANSSEIYDAVTRVWTNTDSMTNRRLLHATVRLADGRVLTSGGRDGGTVHASAEVYDPVARDWALTDPMGAARMQHTATLLDSGLVLVAAGWSGGGILQTAELYDPATGDWRPTGSMMTPRYEHSAVKLPSGRVLVIGGITTGTVPTASVELYDPVTEMWTTRASMNDARYAAPATVLGSGLVLSAGGFGGPSTLPLNRGELYDPVANMWTATPVMAETRYWHTASLLVSGRVLLAGGPFASRSLVYDPVGNRYIDESAIGRYTHAAVTLADGRVLVAGGETRADGVMSSALLYLEGT